MNLIGVVNHSLNNQILSYRTGRKGQELFSNERLVGLEPTKLPHGLRFGTNSSLFQRHIPPQSLIFHIDNHTINVEFSIWKLLIFWLKGHLWKSPCAFPESWDVSCGNDSFDFCHIKQLSVCVAVDCELLVSCGHGQSRWGCQSLTMIRSYQTGRKCQGIFLIYWKGYLYIEVFVYFYEKFFFSL